MGHYNLDDVKSSLKREIDRCVSLALAWEKVTFPTKKDGKPFAVLAKNIDGAKLTKVAYAMQDGENELTVYTHCPHNGYIHDSINAYDLVRYLKDESKKAKTENYLPKSPYLEQVYKYDLDDIKKLVADRIKYLWDRVADLNKQLDSADSIYREFRDAYAKAMGILEESCKEFICKDLYYDLKELVKNRFPYA